MFKNACRTKAKPGDSGPHQAIAQSWARQWTNDYHCSLRGARGNPSLIEIDPPVVIVGDIHGQYADLLRIFNACGFPPDKNYMFLGDYVDRGSKNLETISLLLSYKIIYPEHFFLLRGNHECQNVNQVYGFLEECNRRYHSQRLWQTFQDVFNMIPIVGVVGGRVLCMHGGLSAHIESFDTLRGLRRPIMPNPPCIEIDLLWADPEKGISGFRPNTRGVSVVFGEDVVHEFCKKLDIDLIARAHQVVADGYEFFADRKLVTIFSAPQYCGQFDNNAATMTIADNLQCSFNVFKPTAKAIRLEIAKIKELQLETSNAQWPVKDQTPMGPCDGSTGKD
ncbi:unnamed protein product, partial [Mesorhabditis belari]|uniref:Serine/threonine-protein phosphatase n=1 Tax=Mesorhabditis belari TaxID=2138241 RepID=A0AAF3FC91_9BILA